MLNVAQWAGNITMWAKIVLHANFKANEKILGLYYLLRVLCRQPLQSHTANLKKIDAVTNVTG